MLVVLCIAYSTNPKSIPSIACCTLQHVGLTQFQKTRFAFHFDVWYPNAHTSLGKLFVHRVGFGWNNPIFSSPYYESLPAKWWICWISDNCHFNLLNFCSFFSKKRNKKNYYLPLCPNFWIPENNYLPIKTNSWNFRLGVNSYYGFFTSH